MTGLSILRSPWVRWGLLALIQLTLIGIPLADRLQVQMTGREVTLDVRPVDPRDLLRGDYVIINLAITRVPDNLARQSDTFHSGDTVYVGLIPDRDGIARPSVISLDRSRAGDLAISGQLRIAGSGVFQIDYGLDAFYVREGTGREIERMDASRIHLVAAVAKDGRSLPLRLLVDGKPFKSENAF